MKKNSLFVPFLIICIIFIFAIFLTSCSGRAGNASASGKGQDAEEVSYVELKSDTIPFIIDIAGNALYNIRSNDSVTYFFDIYYPETTAHLYCTFRHITEKQVPQLMDEASRLAYNHLVSSSFVDEVPVSNSYGAEGILYDLGGKAATPFQLMLTDGFSYFFNASLYFDNGSHGEDVPELVEGMRVDIEKLIYSFRLNVIS